ncbi:MAG: MFS transporter [Firmicutes bacterium]|nr:MFS transporter [Bacillota bacterium]
MKNWQRNISFFIAGQMISFIGSLLVQYAIFWYINLETESGTILTIAIIASFMPLLIFSPIAGVLADKMNRKLLIVIADGTIALVTLITAILFSLGNIEIWMLIAVTVVRGIGQAIHGPAIGAAIPLMVPQDKLMRVQGIESGIQSAFNVLGPIVAAILISWFSIGFLFYIDTVTAVIGVLTLLLLVTIPKHVNEDKPKTTNGIQDFVAGLKYVKTHSFLIPFFIYLFFVLILVSPVAFLSPLQVVRSFETYGDEVFRLTMVEVSFSLGMTIGALIVAWWGGFNNRIVTAGIAISIMGFGVFMLGIVSNFYIYFAFMLMQGIVLPFYNTTMTVILQEQVDPAYMGRVTSISTMINSIAMPIGIAVFGPLADILDIEWLMIVSGGLMLVFGFLYFMNLPMMKAGVKPTKTKTP